MTKKEFFERLDELGCLYEESVGTTGLINHYWLVYVINSDCKEFFTTFYNCPYPVDYNEQAAENLLVMLGWSEIGNLKKPQLKT